MVLTIVIGKAQFWLSEDGIEEHWRDRVDSLKKIAKDFCNPFHRQKPNIFLYGGMC